jgi:hypothetical protein
MADYGGEYSIPMVPSNWNLNQFKQNASQSFFVYGANKQGVTFEF